MSGKKNGDDIDLVEFLLNAVNTFRANFWLIVVFFLLGSGLGLAYFFSSTKVFEDRMIISSEILTESYSKILIKNVNQHRQQGNNDILVEQLRVPKEVVAALSSLRMENLNEAEANDTKEAEHFLITAEVTNQAVLPDLQKGLVYYLENNSYVRTLVEQNRTFLKQMIAQTSKEIADLEQFKNSISNGDFFQRAKGATVMLDPANINTKILELTEKKLTYENKLQLSSSVQVIDGFNQFPKEAKPLLSVSIIAGSFVGLIFVGILIAFKSIRRLLQLADEAKKQP